MAPSPNPRVKDITGQSFHHWTAVRFEKSVGGVAYWLFRCVCGAEHVRRGDYIRKGVSRSCGCLRAHHTSVAKRLPRVTVAEKRCSDCDAVKPAGDFSPHHRAPDGLRKDCKACFAAYVRKRREDPAVAESYRAAVRRYRATLSARATVLWRQYGITLETYTSLRDRQGRACAVCGQQAASDFSLCVDHDHATGAVRGLLCKHCNSAIGLLGDTLDGVLRAAAYLRAVTPPASADATPGPTPCESR